MTVRNTDARWGAVSQSFHWLFVVLLVVMSIVGLLMGDLPKTPKYFWVYTFHKSTGITLLALVVLRLGWRLYAGAPHPVPGTPTWQERIASLTHWLLYALLFAMPLSGWLYDSASGLRPFKWYGLAAVPKLHGPDEAVRASAFSVHEWGFWLLLAVVVLHAGAALYHHLFQQDATLARMLPNGWLRAPEADVPPHHPLPGMPAPDAITPGALHDGLETAAMPNAAAAAPVAPPLDPASHPPADR